MHRHPPTPRRGLTLVELLVVVMILGLLAVTVLPNLSNTGEDRRVREAVRSVSSFVAGCQTRALGQPAGSGLWIEVLPTPMGSSSIAIDLAAASVAPPYAGDTTASAVTTLTAAGGPLALTATAATVNASFTDVNPPSSGPYLIRFRDSKTWFDFTRTSGTTGIISMRPSVGQTTVNTAWPVAGGTAALPYEIVGVPTRDSVASLSLGDRVAVDLTNSTVGVQPLLPAGDWSQVVIVFDMGGRPAQLVRVPRNGSGAIRDTLQDSVYLLVASIESIQKGTSLADARSSWIAIDPRGGIPRVGGVATSGTNTVQRQFYVRSGALQTGR